MKLKFSSGIIAELGSRGCFCGLGMALSLFPAVSPGRISSDPSKEESWGDADGIKQWEES